MILNLHRLYDQQIPRRFTAKTKFPNKRSSTIFEFAVFNSFIRFYHASLWVLVNSSSKRIDIRASFTFLNGTSSCGEIVLKTSMLWCFELFGELMFTFYAVIWLLCLLRMQLDGRALRTRFLEERIEFDKSERSFFSWIDYTWSIVLDVVALCSVAETRYLFMVVVSIESLFVILVLFLFFVW